MTCVEVPCAPSDARMQELRTLQESLRASHSYLAYRSRGVGDKLSGRVLPIRRAELDEWERARFALQNVVPVAGLRFILRECRLK